MGQIPFYNNSNYQGNQIINYREPLRTLSANTTLVDTDFFIRVDATAAARTITLPGAVGRTGKPFVIKKIDASVNAVTIVPTGAQTIEFAANLVLSTRGAIARLYSTGSNWEAW